METMKTTVNKKGKLTLANPSKKKVNKKRASFFKGKKRTESENTHLRPKSIGHALEDFTHQDKMIPSFANKKDIDNILEHRISFVDIYNADSHLYLTIAQTLHVFEKYHNGVPGYWREDELPVEYESKQIFHDGESSLITVDKNLDKRFELYKKDLKALRDEFIWIYETGDGYDDENPVGNDELNERRDKAFAALSEIIPSMWT